MEILIDHIYCILTCFANRPHAAGVAIGYIDSAQITATYDPQSTRLAYDIRYCQWLLRSQSWWLSQQVRTCAHRFLYHRKIIFIHISVISSYAYIMIHSIQRTHFWTHFKQKSVGNLTAWSREIQNQRYRGLLFAYCFRRCQTLRPSCCGSAYRISKNV